MSFAVCYCVTCPSLLLRELTARVQNIPRVLPLTVFACLTSQVVAPQARPYRHAVLGIGRLCSRGRTLAGTLAGFGFWLVVSELSIQSHVVLGLLLVALGYVG